MTPELKERRDPHEQERSLLAFDIHDGLLQYANAALMHLQCCAELQGGLNEKAEVEFVRCLWLLQEAIREARELMDGLNSPLAGGLVESIQSLIERRRSPHGPRIELNVDDPNLCLPEAHQLAIFRIIQEGLSNALRHSGSRRIQVRLSTLGDRTELVIRDWGRGFDPKRKRAGHGLDGIVRRARLLKGKSVLKSLPHRGTTLRVELPCSDTFSVGD